MCKWIGSGSIGPVRNLRRTLLLTIVALALLVLGSAATLWDALLALRVTSGMMALLCFLRYPYMLLLLWASVNVCFGSTLLLFNGNHLDLMLIVPSLFLLGFLPWKQIARRLPALLALLLYLAWVLLGLGLSPLDTQAFLTFWITMLAGAALGALTIVYLTTCQRLLRLIDTLLVTGLAVALYGVYGFVTHQNGLVDPNTQLFRSMSLFTQATTCAFYLSLIIPLALYRCCSSRGAMRLVSAAVALCLFLALLLTFTRTASISVFSEVLIMVFCLLESRVRIWAVAGLVTCCGLAFLLLLGGSQRLPFLERFFNRDLATLNGRIYLWQALLSHFQFTQWFGNGLQASDALLAFLHVGNAGSGVIGTSPHNLYLGTLYDQGIVGLLLLLALFFLLAWSLIGGVHANKGERRMLYVVALATLVSVFLQSLVSCDIWIQAVGASFWIIMALPCAFCWPESGMFRIEWTEYVHQRTRSLSDGFPDLPSIK